MYMVVMSSQVTYIYKVLFTMQIVVADCGSHLVTLVYMTVLRSDNITVLFCKCKLVL